MRNGQHAVKMNVHSGNEHSECIQKREEDFMNAHASVPGKKMSTLFPFSLKKRLWHLQARNSWNHLIPEREPDSATVDACSVQSRALSKVLSREAWKLGVSPQ